METFKDRLGKEEIELNDKILKLGNFIKTDNFISLEEIQRDLLLIQYDAMSTYSSCLHTRIKLLEK